LNLLFYLTLYKERKMLHNKLIISAVLVLTTGWVSASQVNIEGLHIDSGTFFTDVLLPVSITSDSSVNLMLTPTAPAWNQAVAQTSPHETSIVSFEPNSDGIWANSYFSSAATGFVDATGLNNSINDGDIFEVNLSGFVVNFNGVSFAQGGVATSTISNVRQGPPGLVLFDYIIAWDTSVAGSPIDGVDGFWSISGFGAVVASPVPVPAAVWLFGSALFGLIGYSRRYSF
jgi:hypothetical protein